MITIEAIQGGLRGILGSAGMVVDQDDMAAWLIDWRGIYRGNGAAVVFPRTTDEVARVVRFCADNGVPVVPQGGNTGLCGGATPDQRPHNVVLNLSRMKAVRELRLDANTVIVEAGCILGDLQRLADDHDRLFALDLAAKDSCQIGGNLSTNAGGINVLRYGMARAQVLGLEVVLPSGEIWHGLRTLKKDNTGYDLKQLFIGAEGTLGIITAAALQLFPKQHAKVVTLVSLAAPAAALALLTLLRAHCGERISAFEYVSRDCLSLVMTHSGQARCPFETPAPHMILVELSDSGDAAGLMASAEEAFGAALEQDICQDVVVAASAQQASDLWALREGITEALSKDGKHLKHDVAVPVERVHAFMQAAQAQLEAHFPLVRPFVFGHYGDGNLHYNIARPACEGDDYLALHGAAITQLVFDCVDAFDGSFSAEHGIGQLKVAAFAHKKDPVEIDMMQAIKRVLDPAGIMNPGKIWPAPG